MRSISEYLRRQHLGLIAIFIALSGSAVAATVASNSVTSRSIKNGGVKLNDLAVNSVDGSKVVDDSLTGADILESSLTGAVGLQGPTGPPGAQGDPGPAGPTGPAGSPDTGEQILGKLVSVDGNDSGLDADQLDGLSSGLFVQGSQAVGGTDLTGTYGSPSIGAGVVGPDELGTVPAARVVTPVPLGGMCSTDIPNDMETTLLFLEEDFDNGGLHPTSPPGCPTADESLSRLTAPRGGVYAISAGMLWAASAAGKRTLTVTKNGGYLAQEEYDAASSGSTLQNVSTIARLDQNDYVQAAVAQTSGVPLQFLLDPRTFLAMAWLGP